MEGIIPILAFGAVIWLSAFLYNDYKKNNENVNIIKPNKSIEAIIKSGLIGGFSSFLLLSILEGLSGDFAAQDAGGIVVISTIISACSGWIVQAIREIAPPKSE